MKTHSSQPMGVRAFGQQGMSFANSLVLADADISSANIDASEVVPAMTGPENGANTSPAIMKIASSRRMVIWRFTPAKSHRCEEIESLPG